MKPKYIKLIVIISIITILSSAAIFLFIRFIQEEKNNDTLLNLSKITEIQNELAAFHFKYGKYPIAPADIIINKSILCNNGFQYNKNDCDELFWEPKNYKMDFIYNQNEDGQDYSIRFTLKDDNKYLDCVHTRKDKKRGCSFVLDLNKGLEVTK